jgi:hypothetical protein
MQSVNSPIADAGVPQTMTAGMPSMTLTAQAVAYPPVPSMGITPQYLLQRLPSIIQPAPVNLQSCNTFAEWISDNGLMVGLGMALAAWLLWKEKAGV